MKYGRVLEEVELLLGLLFFGIAGSIGREALYTFFVFEHLGSVWPNFTGCFVIACAPEMVGPLLLPLITTGFCGSMSSFSEFVTDIFDQSTSRNSSWPNSGYGVPLFIARMLLEICCSFAGYLAGTHLGAFWRAQFPKVDQKERAIRWLFVLFGVAAWAVCLVMSIWVKNDHRWWPLCGVFAPLGVWLRFYLSLLNRPHWFKWGTFTANILATLISCIIELCMRLPSVSLVQKNVMLGIQRGFSGCLSTISTFVKEMCTMRTAHGYAYGALTVFTGYALAFIIIGSYQWTHHRYY